MINIQNFLFIYLFECLQDGHINCDEFVAMMRKGNPEANLKKRRDNLNLWICNGPWWGKEKDCHLCHPSFFFFWYFWRSKVGEISILVEGHVHYLWIGEGNVRGLWVEEWLKNKYIAGILRVMKFEVWFGQLSPYCEIVTFQKSQAC